MAPRPGPARLSRPAGRPSHARGARREELRELGVDHASLGGLLLESWGLPEALVDAVSRHHRSRPGSEAAALVRLADMVAHHAQGNAVDREAMLRLAADWELPVQALRDIVFDQPTSTVGRRRRSELSPLSRSRVAPRR